MNPYFTIAGHGRYVPDTLVTAEEIDQKLNLSAGLTFKHTGVQTRYVASVSQSNADLGAMALQHALASANLQPSDLDLIVCASGSFDQPIPFNACLLIQRLGWEQYPIASFDIDATCLSFLVALDVVTGLLMAGRYRRVAIVTSEIASRSLNPQDPKTYGLFGDAAAAIILEQSITETGLTVTHRKFETHAGGAGMVRVMGGGNARHPRLHTLTDEDHWFQMDAFDLLRFTIPRFDNFLTKFLTNSQVTPAVFDLVIPHQVSRVGLEHLVKTYQFAPETVWGNLDRYGNCIAASLPLSLSEAIDAGRLKPGGRVLLLGTAAGVSLRAMVVEVTGKSQ